MISTKVEKERCVSPQGSRGQTDELAARERGGEKEIGRDLPISPRHGRPHHHHHHSHSHTCEDENTGKVTVGGAKKKKPKKKMFCTVLHKAHEAGHGILQLTVGEQVQLLSSKDSEWWLVAKPCSTTNASRQRVMHRPLSPAVIGGQSLEAALNGGIENKSSPSTPSGAIPERLSGGEKGKVSPVASSDLRGVNGGRSGLQRGHADVKQLAINDDVADIIFTENGSRLSTSTLARMDEKSAASLKEGARDSISNIVVCVEGAEGEGERSSGKSDSHLQGAAVGTGQGKEVEVEGVFRENSERVEDTEAPPVAQKSADCEVEVEVEEKQTTDKDNEGEEYGEQGSRREIVHESSTGDDQEREVEEHVIEVEGYLVGYYPRSHLKVIRSSAWPTRKAKYVSNPRNY